MRIVHVVTVVAAVVLAVLFLFWLFQRRLIYLPIDHAVPPVRSALPGAVDVRFETDDGLELGGWFLAAPHGGAPGPGVLVCNGNAGSRAARVPLALAFARSGLSVLLFDYRGYAGNPGRPSETGLLRDAAAARRYLESRPEVAADSIVIFGESLGAAVALALATDRPPSALILRSPFTSLVDVGRLHYPFLPVRTLLHDRYPSLERIARLTSPLLVVAGDRDTIVPAAHSRELYEAAPGPAKRFVLIEGAGHNDMELLDGDRMFREILTFLNTETAMAGTHEREAR